MTTNLTDNLCYVCNILNNNVVEYLVVGGAAVALHGYARKSVLESGEVADKPDFDVWYNSTYENYFRLLNAIEGLGIDVSKYRKEKSPNPKLPHHKFIKL